MEDPRVPLIAGLAGPGRAPNTTLLKANRNPRREVALANIRKCKVVVNYVAPRGRNVHYFKSNYSDF